MSAEKVSSPVRDRIRGKILSEKVRSTTIELDDGSKVMVRSTTVGQMLATIEMPDAKARMARMLIETCFVAETGEPLFDEADYDALMELPSDGSYRKLVDAVSEQTVEKKTNEAKKPSEQETPGSS